jgi:hypothetical protein
MLIGYPPRPHRPTRRWWQRPGPILLSLLAAVALTACYATSAGPGADGPEPAGSTHQGHVTVAVGG